ncbi:unnamed protein product [Moneuplotes crassus]|uniref:Hexose transporter 1 n=1 Tax=Euplotes crassus TaxID=5936 RepID=A0AAD2DC94_EUPCR|nr:unnamed protein product [Moneuplotes crassus]
MGHFQFGYMVHMMSVLWDITPCIYGFSPTNIRHVNVTANSIFPMMAAVGGAVSWKLSRYGKRKALIASSVICLFGSGILYIGSVYAMIVARGIIGIGFGITSAVCPLFLYEIARARYIEICIVSIWMWINIGFLAPLLLDFFLPRVRRSDLIYENICTQLEGEHLIWREMVIPVSFVAFIQLIFLLFVFRRENPIYEKHLKDVSSSAESLEESSEEGYNAGINYDCNDQQSSQRKETRLEKDTWSNLWRMSERKKIIAGCLMRGFQQLTGVNIILNYALTFVYDMEHKRINLSFTITCASSLFLIPSIIMIKRFGRKNLFMATMIITCLCCCILFQMAEELTLVERKVPILDSMPNTASTIVVWIFFICFWLNFSSTPVLYCSETLTDKGIAIVTAVSWSINTLVQALPSIAMAIIEQVQGRTRFRKANSILFFLLSGTAMVGFFCAALFVIETRGKSRRQMSEEFKERVFSLKNSKIYKH